MNLLDFVFYSFITVVVIQVIYFIGFFREFAFIKSQKMVSEGMNISVIICAKNEAENLKNFLPSILTQEYPNFEVVLINDASTDDTLEIIETFAAKHSNIKIVDVKNTEAFWGNKKYALTLGIKASKHDYLLFTDADCKPVSKYWIQEMSACFDDKKSIVLGYSGYTKTHKSFLNKLIRYETLVTAVQYFSFAKVGVPYMGVGRNLAYTKDAFFKANGFINHIKIRSGDDDLFINQVATKSNTAICITEGSFTQSIPKTTFKDWIKQKRRHISTAKYYKVNHKILLASLYCTQLLFWLLAIILLISTFKWQIVAALVFLRITLYYTIFSASAKKLGENDLILVLPFLEVFLIITQLAIFINNLISKPNHWK